MSWQTRTAIKWFSKCIGWLRALSSGIQLMVSTRLGRVSFRAIKEKRDYMGKRKSASWMYMSRLAAKKEWEFMKVRYPFNFDPSSPTVGIV
jgi:RIO-like serine/threonine protein kinase